MGVLHSYHELHIECAERRARLSAHEVVFISPELINISFRIRRKQKTNILINTTVVSKVEQGTVAILSNAVVQKQ